MDDPAARRQWRKDHVDAFLSQIGVPRRALARSTEQCLDDWARQVQLVTDQPSANWGDVLLHLCRAVESELASSLGAIPGLEFLAGADALGSKANSLKRAKLDPSVKRQLISCGIKPGFVSSTLADKLLALAGIRSETHSAHGAARIRAATKDDARQAADLVRDILRRIVRTIAKGSQ